MEPLFKREHRVGRLVDAPRARRPPWTSASRSSGPPRPRRMTGSCPSGLRRGPHAALRPSAPGRRASGTRFRRRPPARIAACRRSWRRWIASSPELKLSLPARSRYRRACCGTGSCPTPIGRPGVPKWAAMGQGPARREGGPAGWRAGSGTATRRRGRPRRHVRRAAVSRGHARTDSFCGQDGCRSRRGPVSATRMRDRLSPIGVSDGAPPPQSDESQSDPL